MKWVKEKTWKNSPIQIASFISSKEDFITQSLRGIKYVNEHIIPCLGSTQTVAHNECIYENHSQLKNINNKKLLVIGAGPSSEGLSLLDIKKYDLIFSCNHFFENPMFKNIDCEIVFLGDEVMLNNPKLIEYLSEHSDTKICFENIGRAKFDLIGFKHRYPHRTTWANTRYHSKIGAIPRMIAYLCMFEPLEISVIGMDGYIPQKLQKEFTHYFQKNKIQTGTIEQSRTEDHILHHYRMQYLEFWDYILHDIGKNINFYNLGHKHPCNISTNLLENQIGINYPNYLSNKDLRI